MTAIIAVGALIAMLVLAVYFMIVLYDRFNDLPGLAFDKFMKILGVVSGIFYSVLTVSLIASYVILNKSLKQKFKGQDVG